MKPIDKIAYTTHILVSAVANAGTVDVAYPSGKSQLSYIHGAAGSGHYVILDGNAKFTTVALSFGASLVTVTNNTGVTWPAGSTIIVAMDEANSDDIVELVFPFNLASIANGDILTNYRPNLVGDIVHWQAVVNVPATTAAKLSTLNIEIGTTDLTGGALALTSANMTPLGAVVHGAAITGNNRLSRESLISIEASDTTAFIEGAINIHIQVRRDISSEAY